MMTSPTPWDPNQVVMQEVNIGDENIPHFIYDETIKSTHTKI